jgi:hypothetical protein
MSSAALAVLVLLLSPSASTSRPDAFNGDFRLKWIMDGYWGHCEMTIVANRSSIALAAGCPQEEAGKPRGAPPLALSIQESMKLRALLRGSDLFGYVPPGRDMRGLDFPYITLNASEGGRTVDLVLAENSAFKAGVRRELRDLLWCLMERGSKGKPVSPECGPTKR